MYEETPLLHWGHSFQNSTRAIIFLLNLIILSSESSNRYGAFSIYVVFLKIVLCSNITKRCLPFLTSVKVKVACYPSWRSVPKMVHCGMGSGPGRSCEGGKRPHLLPLVPLGRGGMYLRFFFLKQNSWSNNSCSLKKKTLKNTNKEKLASPIIWSSTQKQRWAFYWILSWRSQVPCWVSERLTKFPVPTSPTS